MPVKRNIVNNNGVYFITFTCSNWLLLFQIADAYDSLYNWFNVLNEDKHHILGYLVTPNHIHTI